MITVKEVMFNYTRFII